MICRIQFNPAKQYPACSSFVGSGNYSCSANKDENSEDAAESPTYLRLAKTSMRHFSMKEYCECIDVTREILQLAPQTDVTVRSTAVVLLALVLTEIGDLNQARNVLHSAKALPADYACFDEKCQGALEEINARTEDLKRALTTVNGHNELMYDVACPEELYGDKYEASQAKIKKGMDLLKSSNDKSEAGLLNCGIGYYELREFEKSHSYLKKCHHAYPKNPQAKQEFMRSMARLNESTNPALYDWKKLYAQHEEANGKCRLDVANYKGPITVAKFAKKGRGIVATQEIPIGSIIVCQKAVQVVFEKDYQIYSPDGNGVRTLNFDFTKMTFVPAYILAVVCKLAKRCVEDKEFKAALYELQGKGLGVDERVLNDRMRGKIDDYIEIGCRFLFSHRKYLSAIEASSEDAQMYNNYVKLPSAEAFRKMVEADALFFGVMFNLHHNHPNIYYNRYWNSNYIPVEEEYERILMISTLYSIAIKNGFGYLYEPDQDGACHHSTAQMIEGSMQLYLAPISLLNHSCFPNCIRHTVGDMSVLIARSPIKKGEELTISYRVSHMNYIDRTQTMLNWYGFMCECRVCQAQGKQSLDFQKELKSLEMSFKKTVEPSMVLNMSMTVESQITKLCQAIQTIQDHVDQILRLYRTEKNTLMPYPSALLEPCAVASFYFLVAGAYSVAISLCKTILLHVANYNFNAETMEGRMKNMWMDPNETSHTAFTLLRCMVLENYWNKLNDQIPTHKKKDIMKWVDNLYELYKLSTGKDKELFKTDSYFSGFFQMLKLQGISW